MSGENNGFGPHQGANEAPNTNPWAIQSDGQNAADQPQQQFPQGYSEQGYPPQDNGQYGQSNMGSPFVGDSAPYYAQGGYGQQYGLEYGPADYSQAAPVYQEKQSSGARWAIIALIVLAVIALCAALAFFLLKSGSDEKNTSPILTTSAATTIEAPPTEEAAKVPKRPAYPSLPAGAVAANEAAMSGAAGGDLNNVYRDSTMTSPEFARAVRDAYVEHYLSTKEYNAVITAYSPVTGITYTMDCRDNGEYVTCTGGNNAIVYIV